MSSIRKKLILVAAGVIWILPGGSASALGLQGNEVVSGYDQGQYSAQPLLVSELDLHSSNSVGSVVAIREAAVPSSAGIANSLVIDSSGGGGKIVSIARSLEGEAATFADRVALRFSLADREEAEAGISPLLLSALGLFALIARRRLIAR